jgi:5'(3')-deoxyribonucleotidase
MANIALFDMDGTIADFDEGIRRSLEPMYGPDEERFTSFWEVPDHIEARMEVIKNTGGWWRELPPIEIGIALLKAAQEIGYEVHILTQGPRNRTQAWKEKVEWVREYLGDVDITITRNKGLVYGKILVDDYPDYMLKWLRYRRNGLGIMPDYNNDNTFEHDQVLKLNNNTFSDVVKAMENIYERDED